MNGTLSSSSEWMQLHQQTIDSSFSFSDATTVTTSSCVTSRNNLSPNSSFVAGDLLAPKGCLSKPMRRRPRASKRTLTTLLNTDAKNFRSLVQQFTGCRRDSTSISFGNARGPVNINFALGMEQEQLSSEHASKSQPFVENDYSRECEEVKQKEYQQEEQVSNEEQESEFWADDFLLTSSCLGRSGSEIPQGFVMDDMYFLE